MIILWIVIAIVAVLIIWFIAVFNGIVSLRNRTQEAWSDIDVQLKRRHDLIPNLIETVKGYAKQESSVFEKVTEARAAAINAKGAQEIGEKENALSGALKSVFALAFFRAVSTSERPERTSSIAFIMCSRASGKTGVKAPRAANVSGAALICSIAVMATGNFS